MLVLIYSVVAFLVGLTGLGAFILFVGGWSFMPFSVHVGEASTISQAILVNLGLLLLFGIQHSVMARKSFKSRITKLIPVGAERSTYVLVSGLVMYAFCFHWQALPGELWNVSDPTFKNILLAGHVMGWLITMIATAEIDQFELMGLKQALYYHNKQLLPEAELKEKFLYRFVRHPIQTGVLLGIWINPHMSASLFMLAMGLTIYIFVGLYFEERGLRAELPGYTDYCDRVPMLIPFTKRFDREN